jgi:hypothetical protein
MNSTTDSKGKVAVITGGENDPGVALALLVDEHSAAGIEHPRQSIHCALKSSMRAIESIDRLFTGEEPGSIG